MSCGMLKKGLTWRIGNGTSVKIWGEKWIPMLDTYSVQSHPVTLDRDSLVSVLIDPDTRWWNQALLQENFKQEEVQLIQSIPIGSTSQHDVQIWRGMASGSFMVRSAYHLTKELSSAAKAESSQRVEDRPIWKEIWGLQIANAGKNFLWRACHNLLLTRDNLVRRKITNDPMCPICGLEVETTFHILWACPSSMDVWSGGLRFFQKFISPVADFLSLAEEILQRSRGEEFTIFVKTVRKIWFCKNRWIHKGLFTPPNEVGRLAFAVVEEFKRCSAPLIEEGDDKEMEINKRNRPPPGWFKMNCDAAVDAKNGRMGVGLILRDHDGRVYAA